MAFEPKLGSGSTRNELYQKRKVMNVKYVTSIAVASLLSLGLLAGCGGKNETTEPAGGDGASTPAETTTTPAPESPATSGSPGAETKESPDKTKTETKESPDKTKTETKESPDKTKAGSETTASPSP